MDVWSCFHLLAVTSTAAVNLGIQVSDFLFSDLVDVNLGSKWLNCMVIPSRSFCGATRFLHILTDTCYFSFFLGPSLPDGCGVIPRDFDLHFPSE